MGCLLLLNLTVTNAGPRVGVLLGSTVVLGTSLLTASTQRVWQESMPCPCLATEGMSW
jgi:hypothetical protein